MPDNNQHHSPYPSPAIRSTASNGRLTSKSRGSGSDGAGENFVSPVFLLWVLHQWWKIALPIGLLLAVIASGVVLYAYVPKYRAEAMLVIEDQNPHFDFFRSGGNSDRFINTQLELLKSPVILAPALGRKELAELPEIANQPDRVAYLRKKLLVKPIGRSEMYDITYESSSPTAAALVVNGVLSAFLDHQADDQAERTRNTLQLLEQQSQQREISLQQKRKKVIEMAKDVTGVNPFTGQMLDYDGTTATPMAMLFGELTSLDVEREVLNAQRSAILGVGTAEKDPLEESGLLDNEIESLPEVNQRLDAIAVIKTQMADIKGRAMRVMKNPSWEGDPAFVGLQRELARLEQEVVDAKLKARELVLGQRREQRKYEREQEVAKIDMQLKSIEARRELLSNRLKGQISDAQAGEVKSIELGYQQAELAREEKVFEMIAERMLALQTESVAPARVYLLRKAEVPKAPVEKIPYKLLLVAAAAAFAAPFAGAVAREATVRRISDVEQLSQESGLRVLGEISSLPVRHVAMSPNRLSRRLRREAYIFAESINSLRINIAVADEISAQQVIAVMSALAGEGKTSIATSLAMSIANATETPTLVIDGDLRSPDVSKLLKSRSSPGVFEYLSGKSILDSAIHRVGDSNVYVMPAGRANRSPHHLVRQSEIEQMLEKLRKKFPRIIVDTPPILGASESLVIARAADAALFCSRCEVSRSKQVRLAVDRLNHAGVNVVGAVLSGTSSRRYAYTYGYYAGQGEVTT